MSLADELHNGIVRIVQIATAASIERFMRANFPGINQQLKISPITTSQLMEEMVIHPNQADDIIFVLSG